MKSLARRLIPCLLLAVLLAAADGARAVTETFGSGTNEFSIDFAEIGDARNAPDTNGFGAVAYDYLLGTLEISEDQIQKAVAGGLQNVSAGAWADNKPAGFVHWYEAAAFVNYLNVSAGFSAAYNVAWDADTQTWSLEPWADEESWGDYGENRFRHRDARYFLPSEDEWYKAAYYKGGATNAGYWAYPTAQDDAPAATSSGTNAGTAVFSAQAQPSDVDLSGAPSAYGTVGQGGNMAEWIEGAWDRTNNVGGEARVLRGGHWFGDAAALSSTNRAIASPNYSSDMVGFRVAGVTTNLFTKRLAVALGGTNLVNGAPANAFDGSRPGATNEPRVYTVKNTGVEPLDNVAFSVAGEHQGDFAISLPADGPLDPGQSTNITVTFAPTAGSHRNASISVESDVPDNSPFVVNLSGYGLTTDNDLDNDGLNDAAEYGMSALGFDYRVAQPDLVEGLVGNATFVPLYNETERLQNYNDGLAAGRDAVLSAPGTYGLYTSNSIADLNLGGVMLQKSGDTVVLSVQIQGTPDLATQSFTNVGTPVELPPVQMPGDKGFLRIRALGPQ